MHVLQYQSILQNQRCILNNQRNYFQHGRMDKWRSGDFSMQTWCTPLELSLPKMYCINIQLTVKSMDFICSLLYMINIPVCYHTLSE